MTKAYVKHIKFGLVFLALLNGVWSQELDCQKETKQCGIQAVRKSAKSPEELVDLKGRNFSAVMEKIGEMDICQYAKDTRECLEKIETSKCDTPMELQVKTKVDALKGTETRLGCDNPEEAKCASLFLKCTSFAFVASGTTAEEAAKMPRLSNRKIPLEEFVKPLGKEKGCKYVKNYGECLEHQQKGQCAANEKIAKSIADLKFFYIQKECPRPAKLASLFTWPKNKTK